MQNTDDSSWLNDERRTSVEQVLNECQTMSDDSIVERLERAWNKRQTISDDSIAPNSDQECQMSKKVEVPCTADALFGGTG